MKRCKRFLALAVIFAVCAPCLWAPPARAAREIADLSLEELMQVPVFAASRHEQSLREAPAHVSVVTREEIRAFGWRTVAELLASLPGFSSTYDRTYQYVGVRGFGRPGDYNSRILVLLDGQRINDEIYSSAGVGMDLLLDTDLLERVEVVRGPGSSLYGSSALFAVVNLIPRRGADLAGAELDVKAASHHAFQGRASAGGRFGDSGQYLLSGTVGDSAGQDLFFKEFDAPETNGGRAVGIDGERSANLFGDIEWSGLRLQGAYVDRRKDVPTASWGTVFNLPGNDVHDRKLLLDLSAERRVGELGRVFARLAYLWYEYRGNYPTDLAESGGPAIVTLRDLAVSESWTFEGRFTSEALPGQRIQGGLEYRALAQLAQDFDDGDPSTTDLRSRESGGVFGASFQDEIRLGRRALLNLGLRYDHVEPHSDGRFSPRAGFILCPEGATTVKLLYGEAFRSPNAYELYYNDNGISQKTNPGLGTESVGSYELVLEQELGRRLQATVSLYHYDVRDLINQVVDPADGLLVFRNLGRVAAGGGEIELHLRLPRRLEVHAGYAYANAEDSDTGEWLTNSPRHLASFRAVLSLSGGRVRLAPEVRYVGERLAADRTRLGGVLLANLTLSADDRAGRCEVSLGVLNLFDTAYADPAGNEHSQTAIPQDGLTLRGAVTFRF